VLEQKLARGGLAGQVPLILVGQGQRFRAGPFALEYITVTHSIPEPNALLIGTAAGDLYHSGDWKLDDEPTLGRPYDRQRLRRLGRQRLLGMVCDSTNAVVPGRSGSEGELPESIRDLVEGCGGRVLVTCFASNLARINTIARVAVATGRRFGMLGQSMHRMLAAARATGYWGADLPEPVAPRDLGFLPPGEVLAACTGSQGERRAALSRLALDEHPDLLLDPDDTVIFSSRTIPGNEASVSRLRERLEALGVRVVGSDDARVHVSGHPARDELAQLYEWVRPPVVIPAHGTPRHLEANAAVAARSHVPKRLVGRNGDVVRLAAGEAEIVARVPTGRLVVRDRHLEPVPARVVRRMQGAGR
jgi:ribonuclease J